jgi:hypothetical protein
MLESAGSMPLPVPGSPEWCALDASDARKLAAVLDGCQHWCLRLETEQQARAEASRAISAAADWSNVAREIRQRNDFRKTHPWAKRVVA